ncbi:MAG TPA: serine/threonine-protein kinase [Rudaea sp.]|nr:serine/threonine-protein kinase [Rudaea sp.]
MGIDAETWRRLRPLLDQALDLPAGDRERFLAELPSDAADLTEPLRRLLSEQANTRPIFDEGAAEFAAPLLERALLDNTGDTLGQRVGAYRVTRLLGVGGMGVVYLAERADGKFSQQVALKVVQAGIGASARERFERERRILAGLVHPNIALLYDGGELDDGQAFYTMEYVDGVPITLFCVEADLDIQARVRLLRTVASTLAFAHRNLVVHRDIKPSNILVTDDGQVKLLDFGIAKLIGAGASTDPALTLTSATGPMTPDYAAPEQFRNEPITVATDVYQFGVLCFRLFTGAAPYRADPADPYAWARAVAEEEPVTLARALAPETMHTVWSATAEPTRLRRQLSSDLNAIVRRCLAKTPAERYGSMDAVCVDLDAYLAGRPVSARRGSRRYRFARFVQRHRVPVASAGVVILLLCVTTAFALRQAQIAAREAERANSVAAFLISLFQVSDPGVNRGEKLNANQSLERGAKQISSELSAQPLQRARLLTVIGEVYSALGDFPRAKEPLQSAIDIERVDAEADPVEVGHALRALAWVTHRQGDENAARALLDEAVLKLQGGSKRALDELAGVHSYRGLVLKALGDFAGARSEYELALATAAKAGTDASPKAAAIHNNLALLLRDRGEHKAARVELENALAIYRRAYGEDHYRTIGSTQNLAAVMLDTGDIAGALPLLERTSAQNLRLFGTASSDFANSQNMLGNIARQQKRYDESIAYYARAAASYRAGLGDHHPYLAFPPYNMGETEFARGNYAVALEYYDRALALRRELLPPDHPETADALDARSQALMALHRYEEARSDAEAALAIRRAKLPADAPAVVQSLLHAGLAEYALDHREGAKANWDEALERAPRAYPDGGDELAHVRLVIADPENALHAKSM